VAESSTDLPRLVQLQLNHDEIHLIIGMLNVKLAALSGDIFAALEQNEVVDEAMESLGRSGMEYFATKLSILHKGLCG